MPDDFQSFLHMDDQWMWRFYVLSGAGEVLAISNRAYFTREEAENALSVFKASLVTA